MKIGLNGVEKNLYENIKRIAQEQHDSVKDIAEYLGVSDQTVYHYYGKIIVPSAYSVYRLARLFGLPIHELFGLPDPRKAKNEKTK